MSFNESNTVEQMILDAVENLGRTAASEPMHDASGWGSVLKTIRSMPLAKSHRILRHL